MVKVAIIKYGKLCFLLGVLGILMNACDLKREQLDSASSPALISFPEKAKAMNIYEVNIRQYTPEGTINAFANHLPRLKELGVDILWIMPVQPVGVKARKGTLGSYYSIQNYTAVGAEYGTLTDFKEMVNSAHQLGMVVILDWVANHTSFDHDWIKKEGYHTTDSTGTIIWPEGTDWTDVADLNYDNSAMRQEMIEEMKWWLAETNIDGFRCDVAGKVPNDFWKDAIDSLREFKDVFMLAEWDEPALHDAGFDMTYGWGPHHWMNQVAKGEIRSDSLEYLILDDQSRYDRVDFRMMFTTNHDENSWNGTVFERFGEGHLAYAAWAFTVRGMPLIYSGQEAGLAKRLRFFDKDTIDFSHLKFDSFYRKILEIKKANPALHNGAHGGLVQFLDDNNEDVSSFVRAKGDNEIVVMVNLSESAQELVFQDSVGSFEDQFSGESYELNEGDLMTLEPYQYIVGVKERKDER